MATIVQTSPARRRPAEARPGAGWILAALALLALVAALGFGAEVPTSGDRGFAPAEPQRVLEDWRGNSARIDAPRG